MRWALIFPGQGGQHAAMLRWLDADAPALRALGGAIGAAWRDRMTDDGWAARNAVAQSLVAGTALAAWQALDARLPPPVVVAGYSVGELAAQAAAGVFDASSLMDLARRRAARMDLAARDVPTRLAGVTGLSPARIDWLCDAHRLQRAIRNGPDSVVLGGRDDDLASAQVDVESLGGRMVRLRVGLASHTDWMADAAAGFAADAAGIAFARPRLPLLDGAGDRVRTGDAARQALVRRIDHEVRWDACMEAIDAMRVDCVLEVGAGSALARLWAARHPQVPARSVDEFGSLDAIVAWVTRHASGQ